MIKDVYTNEGIRGFFKGVLSPIVGRAPIAAIMFSGNGFANRFLERRCKQMGEIRKATIAGFFAGFCYSNTAFSFDLLKTKA